MIVHPGHLYNITLLEVYVYRHSYPDVWAWIVRGF